MTKKFRQKFEKLKLGKLPQTEEDMKLVVEELVAWAQLDEAINIEDFALSKLLSPKAFEELCSKSEYFANSYDIALRFVGSRRNRLAQRGLLNPSFVLATLPLYDSDYRSWLRSLRSKDLKDNGQKQIVVVEMPVYKNINSSIDTEQKPKA